MVESHANSVEDYLIDGLSFKLNPGASYVSNRRSVTYFPSGASEYNPVSGSRVIKIKLNGDAWLDPSTVKFQMTINNTSPVVPNNANANRMHFLSGPWAWFRRFRLICGGQIVEDIDDWNRVSEMFHMLSSSGVRVNDSVEGMKAWYDGPATETLLAGQKRTVSMKLLSGLLGQSKYLPIRYAPLEVELELVGNADDCQRGATSWLLSDVQLKCDVCHLDNALENSYAKHLEEGKALPINYGTFISQNQVVNGGVGTVAFSNISINISRAVSRLKSLFITLDGNANNNDVDNLKEFNNFWNPMAVKPANAQGVTPPGGDYDSGKEMELQVQIGSKLFPEYPMRSVSEQFGQLKKALGVHHSAFHSLDITPEQYRSYKWIAAIDTEKVLEAAFTGLNTKAGDLMTIKLKPADAANMGNNSPKKMFVTLHSDQIMEIRESGVVIHD